MKEEGIAADVSQQVCVSYLLVCSHTFLMQSINSSLLSAGGDDTQLKELQLQLDAKDSELTAMLRELEEEKKLHKEEKRAYSS